MIISSCFRGIKEVLSFKADIWLHGIFIFFFFIRKKKYFKDELMDVFFWGPWSKLALLNKKLGYPWLITHVFSHAASLMWYSNPCYHDSNINTYICICYIQRYFFTPNRSLCAWVTTEPTHWLESIQNTQKGTVNFQIRGSKNSYPSSHYR